MKPVFTSIRSIPQQFIRRIQINTAGCFYKLAAVVLLLPFAVNIAAQTPVIVKSAGIPGGNVSSHSGKNSTLHRSADRNNFSNIAVGAGTAGDIFYQPETVDDKIIVSYGTLPVDMLSFNATIANGQSQLYWQTNGENNTDNYEIEYSADGAKWMILGTQKAGGNSAAVLRYSYTHNNLLKGIHYYRIKQNDLNGTYSYSNIVWLVYKPVSNDMVVYPNPVLQNEVNVLLPQTALVQLYNSAGALVYSQKLSEGKQQIDVKNLAKGTYILKAGHDVKQILVR